MNTDETLSGNGFFSAENAVGNFTVIRISDVSSIVADRERRLFIVGMNNGKEFGFSFQTVHNEYQKAISYKTIGADPLYMFFKLLQFYRLPSKA